jgi:hypothetical protein
MIFRRLILSILSIMLTSALALPALAQDQRNGPPFDRGGRGGRGGFDGDRGGRGEMNPGGGPGGLTPGGPMGRGGIEIAKYEALRSYIDVVDRYGKLAQDPDSSAVAAVISASDVMRRREPDAAIDFFTKILPDVSPTVQRAIRIQLADLYKQKGDTEKAMDQYEALMRGTPTTRPAQAAQAKPSAPAAANAAQANQPTVQPGGPMSPGGGPPPPPRPAP